MVDNTIMYTFEDGCPRILVPGILRKKVIYNLHAANQGSSSMLARARKCVYWPGIDGDVADHCKDCLPCRKNTPSFQKEPMIITMPPKYPFQKVCSDMFELEGYST